MNIVFCLPGKSFSGKFLQCWTQLASYCQHNNINLILSQRYSSNVYFARTLCIGADVLRGKHQIPFDGKLDYDYIMWIDSDIIFTVDDFVNLLRNTDKDIVSGLYAMSGGTLYPTVKDWDTDFFKKNGKFDFLKINDPTILNGVPFKVVYTGMGFMLIKKGVYENLEYPWFAPEFFEIDDGKITDFCSEDVSFCRKATKAGFPVWIDPTVIVKHEKTIYY